jgi:hypothetical protein
MYTFLVCLFSVIIVYSVLYSTDKKSAIDRAITKMYISRKKPVTTQNMHKRRRRALSCFVVLRRAMIL